MNDWLLEIVGLLLEVKDRGFLFAPFLCGKPLRNVARPPTPPAESWTGYFLAGVWLSVLYSV